MISKKRFIFIALVIVLIVAITLFLINKPNFKYKHLTTVPYIELPYDYSTSQDKNHILLTNIMLLSGATIRAYTATLIEESDEVQVTIYNTSNSKLSLEGVYYDNHSSQTKIIVKETNQKINSAFGSSINYPPVKLTIKISDIKYSPLGNLMMYSDKGKYYIRFDPEIFKR
jgi:hypothetical protein